MKAFRFPLDRVLHWRTTQCELEEAALTRLTSQRGKLSSAVAQIAAQRTEASDAISRNPEIESGEFQTVHAFHISLDQQKSRLQARARELERQIETQVRQTAEARRKKKLLEKLRESRLTQWTSLRNAEDETAAADSWLARYVSERYTTTNAPSCQHSIRSRSDPHHLVYSGQAPSHL